VQYFINKHKDEGRRANGLKDNGDPTEKQLIRLYVEYEQACARAGVVDFAELLLRALRACARQPRSCCMHYTAGASRHILVDEFQTPTRSSTPGSGCSRLRGACCSRSG